MSVRAMKIIGIIVGLLFVVGSAGAVEFKYPGTHAGQELERFVKAINTGQEEQWKDYILREQKAKDSIEVLTRRLGLFQFIWDDLGGVMPHSLPGMNEEYSVELLVKGLNPSGMSDWATMMLIFDSLPPHGWRAFGMDIADDPNEKYPDGELTEESIAEFMDSYLEDMVAKERFSGTVLIAKNGVPLYTRVDGEASKRFHVPNRLDTKFNLGSMNKMFTGIAIAQLVGQGKLRFEDLVGQHLPDYPNQDVKSKVSVRQLRIHSSGSSD